MNEPFEATGGARVDWTNASWPLAKLTATSTSLRVEIRVLGDYRFTPDTVVSITRYTMIPVLGWGIQIRHSVPEYPARFIFWCLGNPDTLITGIRDAGFLPQAPASTVPLRKGFALRWQTIIVAIAIWNGLFAFDMVSQRQTFPIPGFFSVLAIGLAVAASVAALHVPAFQGLILKPGRSIGEIRPFLNLLLLISGMMFVVLTVIQIFH
jgi:hypothetical protein